MTFGWSISRAEAPPQFAFSTGSNQIPAGIWPAAAGVDFNGKVYISSRWNVIKLDTNGAFLNQWGTQGAGPGQFSYAGKLAFDRAGHVYVIDDYNDRIEEFDTNGTFITTWGSTGTQPGQFQQPQGLAVSPAGRIYVTDSLNFRVQVFSRPGVFLEQFGTLGTNSGQFSFPGEIAVDSSNNVYVTDSPGGPYDDYRVQKFDADGNFLTEWAAFGTNTGGSIQVGGIATDRENNVYVANGSNNRVEKFTSDGVFLAAWGSFGTGPGQFNTPSGIALDPTGNYVYVGDYYNARVNVFAYSALEPLMYQSPTNQVVPAGAILRLDAGVFGAQPLDFEWRFNGAAIPGSISSELTISNAPLSASGAYSVSASNSLGSVGSSGATISVLPAVVTTLPVSGITATSVVLYGSFWVGSHPTTAWFEWGTNNSYGNLASLTNLNVNTSRAVPCKLSGLDGEVLYHYRAAASNDLGTVYGQDLTFQVGLKPTVVTLPVVTASAGSVVLNASVNPEARDTSAFFEWGSYYLTQFTPTNQLANSITPVALQTRLDGLKPGFVYIAQAVATNQLGTARGEVVRFVAPPWVLLPAPLGIDWPALAVSADGAYLAAIAAGTHVFVSTNSGISWSSNTVPDFSWQAVNMSADASRWLIAAGATGTAGPLYFSTNFGKSWTKSTAPNRNWEALASSGDGLKVAAVDSIAQQVLISANGGLNWSTNSQLPHAFWSSIASSADGQRLIVAAGAGADQSTNGPVYTSTDGGASWSLSDLPLSTWRSVASSADGRVLLAAVGLHQNGPIYVSTNGGSSWVLSAAPANLWQAVAVSADGSRLAALTRVSKTPVFTSTNWGASWQLAVLPQAIWTSVALSADGAKLFAAGDQNIVTLQTSPTLGLQTGRTAGNLSLSWVIPSSPITLQGAGRLTGQQWTNLVTAPVSSPADLRQHFTLPITGPSGFFRLRRAE